jgi:hypothetical protein
MKMFEHARELLRPGETGLFVFTDGRHFVINQDGSGSTGLWVIDPSRRVDRIVVFRQVHRDGLQIVELFSALPDGVSGPDQDRRYTLKLLELQMVGSTNQGWRDFADAGQNPVRYVSRQGPKA